MIIFELMMSSKFVTKNALKLPGQLISFTRHFQIVSPLKVIFRTSIKPEEYTLTGSKIERKQQQTISIMYCIVTATIVTKIVTKITSWNWNVYWACKSFSSQTTQHNASSTLNIRTPSSSTPIALGLFSRKTQWSMKMFWGCFPWVSDFEGLCPPSSRWCFTDTTAALF